MKCLIFILLVMLCMASCKPKIYKDENGREYYMRDTCLSGHMQQQDNWTMIGDQQINMPYEAWVCDECAAYRVYLPQHWEREVK